MKNYIFTASSIVLRKCMNEAISPSDASIAINLINSWSCAFVHVLVLPVMLIYDNNVSWKGLFCQLLQGIQMSARYS